MNPSVNAAKPDEGEQCCVHTTLILVTIIIIIIITMFIGLLGSKRLTIILIFIGYWGQQAHATSQQAILLIFIAITTLTLGIYSRPNLRKSIPQQYMQCILMGAFYVKFNRRRG